MEHDLRPVREKKLFIAALRQTLPERLIEQTASCSAISHLNCSLVYQQLKVETFSTGLCRFDHLPEKERRPFKLIHRPTAIIC